jgi:AraC-like DNA-binding protein
MSHPDSAAASYRELPPPAALGRYLACVWLRTTHADETDLQSRVLPDGCIDVVWLGEAPPFVAGPATRPVLAVLPAESHVAGLRFRPGMAPSLLGLPASALLDAEVPLDDVWGASASHLLDRAGRSPSAAARVVALQEMLVARLPHAAPPDELVLTGIAALARRADTRVRELADRLGVGERQLLRRFNAAVGYGPKTFGRILRFRRAVRLGRELAAAGRLDLADLAATLRYADQAHLAREFAEFAGAPPTCLLAREGSPGHDVGDRTPTMSDSFKTAHRSG